MTQQELNDLSLEDLLAVRALIQAKARKLIADVQSDEQNLLEPIEKVIFKKYNLELKTPPALSFLIQEYQSNQISRKEKP